MDEGAFGLVATHDLELAALEQESRGRIRNDRFREYFRNEELQFDYKLRAGVATASNALHLIEMMGIGARPILRPGDPSAGDEGRL